MEFLNFVQHVRLEREGMEEPTIVHCRCLFVRVSVCLYVCVYDNDVLIYCHCHAVLG